MERHPDIVKAIGMISVEMGNLEIFLGDMLGALLHIDRVVGRTVYLTPKSAYGRIEILKNVVAQSMIEGTDLRKAAESLISRGETVIGKRHEFMHEAWGLSEEDQTTVVRRRLPFTTRTKSKPVTLEELRRLIQDIRELAHDVILFRDEIYRDWPPYTWPEDQTTRPGQK